ncbi:hypothetical protein HYFRA_00004720 [Hymenoscyphus fraxineus]|uniref:G-patch domain-containing protein n=1 Tax=Hymenoscyphus fraxineus TaxID=746836 RepID=A0A9N9KZ68_9HELO|nr:hypothetical protein HYFRA_00004720 [Hymenoscyphus fraxineus]
MSDEDDTYEIPLQDQRVFGAGIKRKRVKFVPSTSNDPATRTPASNTSAKSVSDLYLKLVLPSDPLSTDEKAVSPGQEPEKGAVTLKDKKPAIPQVCEICNLPLSSDNASKSSNTDLTDSPPLDSKPHPHEASLAHQVCLTHSYPPSHIDRNRKGLAYLSSYGWDPDSRLGLGASGQGIQLPIKTKPKDDKMGIGVVLPNESERRKKVKTEKYDAGKVKKMYEKDKKKTERLREMFYRNDDVEKYLGGG